jgi:hypothetical protein
LIQYYKHSESANLLRKLLLLHVWDPGITILEMKRRRFPYHRLFFMVEMHLNKINKIDLLENSVIMSIYPYWYWRKNR